MSLSLTQALGAYVARPPFDAAPDDVAAVLRMAFIDTIACLFAGRDEAVSQAARALVQARGSRPQARMLFGSERAGLCDAAFVNAVAGHALDYDDMALNGHPSVVLVPALLAAGEAVGALGSDLLRAYLVGYEVWAELMRREPDSLHGKGWHPTSVLGTVGVAAAVANLYRLDAKAAQHALGIAASLASGVMGNFGSMTKPLHAGWAASHGLEAVLLAQQGVTASPDVLEGPAGYLAALSPQGRADRSPWEPAGELRFRTNGLSIKKYPVCYAAHRVIDGVLALRQAHGFTPDQVVRFVPSIADVAGRVLHRHAPTTALEAKFSIEFACAMAALAGSVGLREVTDEQVGRPEVQALMTHVAPAYVPPGCPIEPGFALHDRVRIELRDGSVLDSGPIRFARGHAQQALTADDVVAKWQDCLRQEPDGRRELLRRLQTLGLPDAADPDQPAWLA